MYLDIDNNKYEIIIEIKNNKNTYIRVKEDLKIHVYTNKYMSLKKINKLINDNTDTIKKMIDRELNKKTKSEKFMILGKSIDVIILPSQKVPELYGDKLYINDKSKLTKYIKELAFTIFSERINAIYNKFDEKIPYPKLKVRKMTTRWGVCNRKDISITLNLELIRIDLKYLDYVIVHELSHFIHFDHSKNFWNLVNKYCSDYKGIRKEMRE